jgi:hypothetical protein
MGKFDLKRIVLIIFSILTFGVFAHAQTSPIRNEAQGTWRFKENEIRIESLGPKELRVQLDLVYSYKFNQEPMANIGFSLGIANIKDRVATFVPRKATLCQISLKFVNHKLIVEQITGDYSSCGWGKHVSATGVYKRISGKKPRFDLDKL